MLVQMLTYLFWSVLLIFFIIEFFMCSYFMDCEDLLSPSSSKNFMVYSFSSYI